MTDPSEIGALHAPVLAERCTELLGVALAQASDPVVVDATLGMGGHGELLLQTFPNLHLIGIDRDPQALELAGTRLRRFGSRFEPVHAVYDQIGEVIGSRTAAGADGILFDLGVSSLQLDRPERGFAYAVDAPLDMRMDQSTGSTAADLLNDAPEAELRRILHRYGQERFAGRIAAAVVRRRGTQPWERTGELVELIRDSIPAPARRRGGNPAKRTFQALRIAVNSEIEALRRALPAAIDHLALGGAMVVMSYHSGEDRVVKDAFRAGTSSSTPIDLPTELAGHEPRLRSLTRGAEVASEAEQLANPRSASVRLRAVQRIREGAATSALSGQEPSR